MKRNSKKIYKDIYDKMVTLGFDKEVKYHNRLDPIQKEFNESINTLEEFQELINKFNIETPTDFQNKTNKAL